MNTVLLPDTTIWLEDRQVRSETLLSVVDRTAMMLNTFVADPGHELHSSFVDPGDDAIVASHLLVAAGMAPEPSTQTLPERALARPDDRRLCLLEHLAILREALELAGIGSVRMDVGESALRLADAAGRPAA